MQRRLRRIRLLSSSSTAYDSIRHYDLEMVERLPLTYRTALKTPARGKA